MLMLFKKLILKFLVNYLMQMESQEREYYMK